MAKVVIYSKSYCPFCDRAKHLFRSKNQPFEDICLDQDAEGLKALYDQTGMRTVPQIFIGDTFIGGFQELSALDAEGKLDPLIFSSK